MAVKGKDNMKRKDWNKRISKRNDMVSRITHLTRGKDNDEAFENLWQILIDKKINGNVGMLVL